LLRVLVSFAVLLLYAAHQDFWFAGEARPIVFGYLPIGLFYHACYTLAAAVLMAVLVKVAWPGGRE